MDDIVENVEEIRSLLEEVKEKLNKIKEDYPDNKIVDSRIGDSLIFVDELESAMDLLIGDLELNDGNCV